MNVLLLLPEISLTVIAIGVIILDLLMRDKRALGVLAGLSLVVPAGFSIMLSPISETSFFGTLTVDAYAIFFKLVFLGAAALVIFSSGDYVAGFPRHHGEYYALILFATVGMMLMASTTELISLFIALELASVSLYVLAGMMGTNKSAEAGLKYLLLGAFSSALLLYGMALLFGLTGSTQFETIATTLANGLKTNPSLLPSLLLAVAFLVGGLGFKIAAVPFQMWTPDVYEGAPTPVTAFLSVASKAAGFAALLRIFLVVFGGLPVDWPTLFAVLAALSMFVGNVVAIMQSNIKRMMAYSSVAQAGYLLVGVAAGTLFGVQGVLFYIVSYALTNLGAFIAIIAITQRIGSDLTDDFAGMSRRAPWLAFGLTICLLSLIGIPPTSGFLAKFILFGAAVEQGLTWLVALGVINSVISAYYYLRPVKAMYLSVPAQPSPIQASGLLQAAFTVAVVGVFVVFAISSPFLAAAQAAGGALFK